MKCTLNSLLTNCDAPTYTKVRLLREKRSKLKQLDKLKSTNESPRLRLNSQVRTFTKKFKRNSTMSKPPSNKNFHKWINCP